MTFDKIFCFLQKRKVTVETYNHRVRCKGEGRELVGGKFEEPGVLEGLFGAQALLFGGQELADEVLRLLRDLVPIGRGELVVTRLGEREDDALKGKWQKLMTWRGSSEGSEVTERKGVREGGTS